MMRNLPIPLRLIIGKTRIHNTTQLPCGSGKIPNGGSSQDLLLIIGLPNHSNKSVGISFLLSFTNQPRIANQPHVVYNFSSSPSAPSSMGEKNSSLLDSLGLGPSSFQSRYSEPTSQAHDVSKLNAAVFYWPIFKFQSYKIWVYHRNEKWKPDHHPTNSDPTKANA